MKNWEDLKIYFRDKDRTKDAVKSQVWLYTQTKPFTYALVYSAL